MQWLSLFSVLLLLTVHNTSAQSPIFPLKVSADQQGQFVQEKHLKVLSQPFVTKGNYHYQKNKGLVWHTQQPIESEIKITTDGVSERQPGGNFKTLTTNSQFSELLLALFSGEQQSLRQQFTLEQQKNSLTLIPKAEKISRVIWKITLLLGEDGIQKIVLYEPGDNYTNIFLSETISSANQD
jgi:hypothetical protein